MPTLPHTTASALSRAIPRLRPLPDVASRVLQLVTDPEYPIDELIAVVSSDATLVARQAADLAVADRARGHGAKDELAHERNCFGLDHGAVAGLVTAEWQLPGNLTRCLRGHHDESTWRETIHCLPHCTSPSTWRPCYWRIKALPPGPARQLPCSAWGSTTPRWNEPWPMRPAIWPQWQKF